MGEKSRKQVVEELLVLSKVFSLKEQAKQEGLKFTITLKKANVNPLSINSVASSVINIDNEQKLLRMRSEEILNELTKKVGKKFAFTNHIVSTDEKRNKFILLTEDVSAEVLRARKKNAKDEEFPKGSYIFVLYGDKAGELIEVTNDTLELIEHLVK